MENKTLDILLEEKNRINQSGKEDKEIIVDLLKLYFNNYNNLIRGERIDERRHILGSRGRYLANNQSVIYNMVEEGLLPEGKKEYATQTTILNEITTLLRVDHDKKDNYEDSKTSLVDTVAELSKDQIRRNPGAVFDLIDYSISRCIGAEGHMGEPRLVEEILKKVGGKLYANGTFRKTNNYITIEKAYRFCSLMRWELDLAKIFFKVVEGVYITEHKDCPGLMFGDSYKHRESFDDFLEGLGKSVGLKPKRGIWLG